MARVNPFAPLYEIQNSGTVETKARDIPAFPRLIDVELTSLCNFRCVMCPTGLLALKRPSGFMSVATFMGIVAECSGYGTALRLIGWGEPTLHPNVVDFVRAAGKVGLLTHINTNASKITPGLAEALVDAGLSSIKFSFQGTDHDTYAEMRQTPFFAGMLRAIEMMRNARATAALPFIAASTSTTYETAEQIETFRAMMEPLVDHLSIGKTTFDYIDQTMIRVKPEQFEQFVRLMGEESLDKQHPDPCSEVWDKLSIAWDGTGRVCCNDATGETDLGKIGEATIEQMWHHPVIEAYRERLARKEYTGPLCSVCYQYMELTPGQAA